MIYRSAVVAQGDAVLPNDLPVEVRGEAIAAAGGASSTPFEDIRTAAAENAALAAAKIVAESMAAGEPALTAERALDFLFASLGKTGEPVLPQLERAMLERALAAADGDAAKAAAMLGLTKAAVQKKVRK